MNLQSWRAQIDAPVLAAVESLFAYNEMIDWDRVAAHLGLTNEQCRASARRLMVRIPGVNWPDWWA
jgi:hypothetical protein